MEWSRISATNAYLDTIKLCSKYKENSNSYERQEPESNEFLSALAAGMNAKVIVEITSEVSTSTIALAAAARQTGGKFVCIIPQTNLEKSQKAIQESGLDDMVEFQTGDPADILPKIETVDFSLVDCKTNGYDQLFDKLDINPKRSIVVTNNLVEGRKGFGGYMKQVGYVKHPIGKGMEITMIGKINEIGRRDRSIVEGHVRSEKMSVIGKRNDKSKWISEVDEKSGEEHIFRIRRNS